ncbi:hypothetical protein FS749_015635 [Ceratobasidium sp. UAMH 11750]|nr:hypothetical protein FS749_015635 [Ceratobasidium sp. UAMH 11750]
MAAPVPAPSFVITRTEEWPEADFDLPDDQESFAIENEGEAETDVGDLSGRLKGSRPSLSGAGAVAKLGGAPVEDEDWDAEFEDPPPRSTTSTTSSMSASLAKFAGKVTRLGSLQLETSRPVEDWSDDGDIELPEPSHTNLTLARAPLPQPDVPELEDTGDVSTIKVAKLNFPSVAALSKSASSSKSPAAPNEDDDFEADFALPEGVANLSLKILTPQTSTLSLRHKSSTGVTEGPWGEMTTSSSAYSDTSSLLSMYPADASPSVTSSSQPGTETDPSDADFGVYEEDEDEAFDGLVLPEGLAGKALAKHLEIKKKVVPAKIAAEQFAKGSNTSQSHKAPNEAEDFETGLLIGDDEDLSPSRLRTRREAIDTPRSKSVPVTRSANIIKPRLRTESVMEVLASASNPSITRSRSPNSSSRGSLPRKDSRSSLVSPNFSSLRPSSLRTTSSTLPHTSASTLNLLTIPGAPPVPSSIAPRPAPLKHQKSVGRLQLSSPSGASLGGQRLSRKASLSSLADASANIPTSSSGTPSTSSTLSARSGGFNAPTAASKARSKPDGREQAEGERKRSYAVPPTRPTTPSANPVALRLTMPTSSSRQKIRPAISSVFPSPATATSQSFADRATSPQSTNPRRTPTSPRRIRTRSGNSVGATPSSSISSITSAATSVKVLRKPKRGISYGDGTELDAFEDLPEDREKERLYRVHAVGRGGVPRGEKGSATAAAPAVASGGTIGRKGASATGTLRRPPSSASSHGSMGKFR